MWIIGIVEEVTSSPLRRNKICWCSISCLLDLLSGA